MANGLVRGIRVESTHPHGEICELFKKALAFGGILIMDGAPQLAALPRQSSQQQLIIPNSKPRVGLIIFYMALHFCPFCGECVDPAPGREN